MRRLSLQNSKSPEIRETLPREIPPEKRFSAAVSKFLNVKKFVAGVRSRRRVSLIEDDEISSEKPATPNM